jgi:hypothetical protein
MEGGKFTHKAGMLLKNRAIDQALWAMVTANRSPKPPVEGWGGTHRGWAGEKKGAGKGQQTQ